MLTHNEKIDLSESREILKTDMETAKVLNTFLSNVFQNLNSSRFADSDPLTRNIKDTTLKTILNYRKHPSIISIESRYRNVSSFSFVKVSEADVHLF